MQTPCHRIKKKMIASLRETPVDYHEQSACCNDISPEIPIEETIKIAAKSSMC